MKTRDGKLEKQQKRKNKPTRERKKKAQAIPGTYLETLHTQEERRRYHIIKVTCGWMDGGLVANHAQKEYQKCPQKNT